MDDNLPDDSLPQERRLALAAAAQAADGMTEMIRIAREGPWYNGPFHPDTEPVEKLLDAAKLAIEVQVAVEGDDALKGDLGQIYAAIVRHLEGWA